MKKYFLLDVIIVLTIIIFSSSWNKSIAAFSYMHNYNIDNSEDVQVVNYTNKKIYLTKDDIYLMAQIVHAESESEPFEGKIAVASVILNRTVAPGFPKTIESVIRQKNAFSCLNKNGSISKIPDQTSFEAVEEALKGKDPTNNALYFYNPKISTCNWMKNVSKNSKKIIGNHVFFKTN
ncbi:cell wall hydrolase [Clostridium botulinum]|uniref:cell wall hydrolase n=1 Tax=Clostridium botulinum TaxID=1491 RepID=UPI0009475154|nr:cell wall hydrolase [Clostridium botulinum]APQ77992.1 cell Wall Hydrolase family protein [Clostridium botulinum]AUN00693.1 cell wall hydrolase [Clostridium botulinum]MBN3355730.1 cell wall hydrolase [Clostridium botulinum]QDY30503.1 cell wall hydrolase [Clostridium botulinum]